MKRKWMTVLAVVLMVCLAASVAAFTACGGSSGVNVGEEQPLDDPLATPSDFTVSENGDYSFSAVENANYYYLTIYRADDATLTSDYLKMLKIDTVSGKTTYSGNIVDDLGFTDPGYYSIQLVAYPVRGSSSDHSYRALATYGKTGTIAKPVVTEKKEVVNQNPFGGTSTSITGGIAYDNNYGNSAPLVIALDNKEELEGGKLRVEVFSDEAMTKSVMSEDIVITCANDEVVTKTLISKDETSTFYMRLTGIGDGEYTTPAMTESVTWSGTIYTLSKITY